MSTSQRTICYTAIAAALAVFALGCGEKTDAPAPKPKEPAAAAEPAKPPAPPAPPAPATGSDAPSGKSTAAKVDAEVGKADYQIHCASCHGAMGEGDGPVAQALAPKPAKHSDGAYMNALSDDYLFKVIKFGGASVGKSPMMAPLGGSLSDQQIYNVIAFMRTLADPPYEP